MEEEEDDEPVASPVTSPNGKECVTELRPRSDTVTGGVGGVGPDSLSALPPALPPALLPAPAPSPSFASLPPFRRMGSGQTFREPLESR